MNTRDIALEQFEGHVLELLRLTKGRKPQRFLKVYVPNLPDLAVFLTELVALKKLSDEAAADAASAEDERSPADAEQDELQTDLQVNQKIAEQKIKKIDEQAGNALPEAEAERRRTSSECPGDSRKQRRTRPHREFARWRSNVGE